MLLIRSWPVTPPPGHARIEDAVERVLIDNFDYRPLAAVGDDVVHIDWDVAVSPEDLHEFATVARMYPAAPLVAPMCEYPGGLHGTQTRALTRPTWNVRRYTANGTTEQCEPGSSSCHLFGFGMVYLPADLMTAHVKALEPGAPFTDIGFSGWYSANGAVSTDLCWSVRPVHLNYPAPKQL